jgi:DNA-directed RNA polymerase specialized sigma24 family protein
VADIRVGYFGSFVTSTPVNSPTLRRYRAERLLRRDFAGLRAQVLAIVRSRLRAQGVKLDAGDLDACYAQAWSGLYATVLSGRQVDNPAAWLVLVTFRRAIDESRAAARRRSLDESSTVSVLDPDLAGTLDDRAKLQQLLEGLRGRLSERECQAASLCYLQGLSRSQAAARLGLSEARMRKLMDGAGPGRPGLAGKVGALLDTIKAGGWCEQQASLMRAYAFGILDPEGPRHALAVLHCRECPACRAHVATLRGLAAVLPPLPLRLALAGGAGVGTASGSAAGSGSATAAGSGSAGVGAGLSTGVGWSGGAGSLAAKLVVTGVLALALGGYVEFVDNSPHHHRPQHSPRASIARLAPLARAYPNLYEGDFGLLLRSARLRHRTPRHTVRRSHPAHGGEALTHEFGPERVPAATAASTRPPVSGNPAAGTAREFGFE